MIGNFTQRRERLQAQFLSLHLNEPAANSFSPKTGIGFVYADLSLRLCIALVSWFTLRSLNLTLHPAYFRRFSDGVRIDIGQNLSVAALFNALGIILAATGLIYPSFAAAAMLFSTFVVVGNSLRLNPTIPSSH